MNLSTWKGEPVFVFCLQLRPSIDRSEAEPLLFDLDAGELDHLRPLFGGLRDDRRELRGRAPGHRAAQFFDALPDLGILEAGVELLVEQLDDVGRRGLGYADA